LRRIVEIHQANPELGIESHARALAHLADWNLIKNNTETAFNYYNEAYQLLLSNNVEQEKIDVLFGKPKSIPQLMLPLPAVDKQLTKNTTSYGELTYNVTEKGKAHNIMIIEPRPEGSNAILRSEKRKLKTLKFRPRFENGHPVATQDVKIKVAIK